MRIANSVGCVCECAAASSHPLIVRLLVALCIKLQCWSSVTILCTFIFQAVFIRVPQLQQRRGSVRNCKFKWGVFLVRALCGHLHMRHGHGSIVLLCGPVDSRSQRFVAFWVAVGRGHSQKSIVFHIRYCCAIDKRHYSCYRRSVFSVTIYSTSRITFFQLACERDYSLRLWMLNELNWPILNSNFAMRTVRRGFHSTTDAWFDYSRNQVVS